MLFIHEWRLDMPEIDFLEDRMPVAPLKIVVMDSIRQVGDSVNRYLADYRLNRSEPHRDSPAFQGYTADNYEVSVSVPRFGSGEGKGILNETVRGKDLYILTDVCNYSLT